MDGAESVSQHREQTKEPTACCTEQRTSYHNNRGDNEPSVHRSRATNTQHALVALASVHETRQEPDGYERAVSDRRAGMSTCTWAA